MGIDLTIPRLELISVHRNFSSNSTWFELEELPSSALGQIGSVDLMPAFLGLIELSGIVEEVLFKVFSTKMVKKPRRELVLYRSARLEELSVRLGRWYSALPVDLTWNQWNPNPGTLKPHVLILKLVIDFCLRSLPVGHQSIPTNSWLS